MSRGTRAAGILSRHAGVVTALAILIAAAISLGGSRDAGAIDLPQALIDAAKKKVAPKQVDPRKVLPGRPGAARKPGVPGPNRNAVHPAVPGAPRGNAAHPAAPGTAAKPTAPGTPGKPTATSNLDTRRNAVNPAGQRNAPGGAAPGGPGTRPGTSAALNPRDGRDFATRAGAAGPLGMRGRISRGAAVMGA